MSGAALGALVTSTFDAFLPLSRGGDARAFGSGEGGRRHARDASAHAPVLDGELLLKDAGQPDYARAEFASGAPLTANQTAIASYEYYSQHRAWTPHRVDLWA